MIDALLDELAVHNLGLLADATVEPGPGLVVISGETGTGKTLLLGALRLLRGETAAKDLIGPDGDEVAVSGRFLVGGDEVILARRVTTGRSRAYRDGAMVPAKDLAAAAAGLVEIVGQHDHLALVDRDGVRRLLDGALDEHGAEARRAYDTAWAELRRLEERRRMLGGDRHRLERERDVAGAQAAEIDGAAVESGSEEELLGRAIRLRNSESLAEHLTAAEAALGEEGATAALAGAGRELELAARTDPSLRPLVDQLGEVASLLGDLVAEVAGTADDLERDPAALEAVERRLAQLADLKRKYGDDLAAVAEFGREASRRAAELEALLAEAGELDAALTAARGGVVAAGAQLSAARRGTAELVAASAAEHLAEMGLPGAVVRFAIDAAEPAASGCDHITLEFASEASLPAGPVGRTASGGELSRLVLALRLAAGVADVPIIAFDEIDAGVGGATALAVGAKLASLAAGRQVLCVTHLPQVAAHASTHLVVSRHGGVATVRAVAGDQRIEELTRMLSGLPDSDQGRRHAAELLALAGS